MPIVKYKLERGNDGEGRVPAIVEDGGYWFSSIDETLLGWKFESQEGFFRPAFVGNVAPISKIDAVNRALEMHAASPFTNRGPDLQSEPVVLTEAEVTAQIEEWYDNMYLSKTGSVYVPTNDEVNIERERRIAVGCNVTVNSVGTIYVTGRAEDIRNMAGLGQGAIARIMIGDTTTIVPYRDGYDAVFDLTPPQMLELWQKSAGYVSSVYQASWEIKANTVPIDYKTNDSYWPVREL